MIFPCPLLNAKPEKHSPCPEEEGYKAFIGTDVPCPDKNVLWGLLAPGEGKFLHFSMTTRLAQRASRVKWIKVLIWVI